ncbi:hypothetical protein LIER_24879 [Lithospermum erythrorhizon]|uniref:Uncharacterized protein n=1 Tax=Lithospermum erythrorhizon TaxID=34254 RepID=A0AAV3R2Q8_LITER
MLEPTIDDARKDPMVEGMDVDVPTTVDTEPLIAMAADGGVLPSVTNICVETTDIQEVTHEDADAEAVEDDVHDEAEGHGHE